MNTSHLNIYAATIPDRMHHLDLGLFNYQVTYTRELLKEWCGQIAVNELDNRLARIPRFSGLKIFKNGLENIKRFTADEFRNMMKVFVFVIEGIIKKHHKGTMDANNACASSNFFLSVISRKLETSDATAGSCNIFVIVPSHHSHVPFLCFNRC